MERNELTRRIYAVDAATLSEAQRTELGITTPLPKSLAHSLDALEADDDLHTLLKEDLVRNYIIVKRAESARLLSMSEETRRLWLIERY